MMGNNKLLCFIVILFLTIQLNDPYAKESNKNLVPAFPPGFKFAKNSCQLIISDYSGQVKKAYNSLNIKYSVIWNFEKKYKKSWKEFNKKEKRRFYKLRKSLSKSLKKGIDNAGGKVEFKKSGSYKDDGQFYCDWRVTHPDHKHLTIWWVRFNSFKISADGNPFMMVYISHTNIE
ncbi:hypothetical protein ACFL35_05750 [Candidatus Riflebacteria bacterium]